MNTDNLKDARFPPENVGPSMEYSLFHEVYNLESLQELLLNNPHIINEKDEKSGWTLLMNAVTSNDFDLTDYLLKAGADPDISNIYDETPLYHAVESKNYKIINCLLENGANTNLQQQDGDTPLHLAVVKGDYKIVKLLLLYKADPTITTFESGQTPLDIAYDRNQTKIIDILSTKMKEIGYFNNHSNYENEHTEEDLHSLSQVSASMKATSQFLTPTPDDHNNYSTFNPQLKAYNEMKTPNQNVNESFHSQKNNNYPQKQSNNDFPSNSINDSTNISNLSISTNRKNVMNANMPSTNQLNTQLSKKNFNYNIESDASGPMKSDMQNFEEKLYNLHKKIQENPSITSNKLHSIGMSAVEATPTSLKSSNGQKKADLNQCNISLTNNAANSSFTSYRNQKPNPRDDAAEKEDRYLGNTNSSIGNNTQILKNDNRVNTSPYLNINFSQDNLSSLNKNTIIDDRPQTCINNDLKQSYNQSNKNVTYSNKQQPQSDLFSPIRNTDGPGFASNTSGPYRGVSYTPGNNYHNTNNDYINDSINDDMYSDSRIPYQKQQFNHPQYQHNFNQQYQGRDPRNPQYNQNYQPRMMYNDQQQNYSMYNYQNNAQHSYINSPQYNQSDLNRSYQNNNIPNLNNQSQYFDDRGSQINSGNSNYNYNYNYNPINKNVSQINNTTYYHNLVNPSDNQLLKNTQRSVNNHGYSNQSQPVVVESDSSFKQSNSQIHSNNPSSCSINVKQSYPSNSRASNKINHAVGNSIYSQGRREDDTIGAEMSRITVKNNTLHDSTLDYNFPLQQTGKVGNFESMKSESSGISTNSKVLNFKLSFQRRNSFTLKPKVRYAEPFYDDAADLARFISSTNDIEVNNLNTYQNHSRKASSIYYQEDYDDHFTYGNNQTQSNVNTITGPQTSAKLQKKKSDDTFGFSQTSKSFKNDLIRKDTKEIQESVISEKVFIDKKGSIHQLEEKLELDEPHHKELYEFLCGISLGKYIQNFLKNGFDDLGQMIEQMGKNSKEPLTDQNLADIGIKLPGHRARILIKLEEISKSFDFELPKGLYYNLTEEFAATSEANYDQHVKYVENWLQQMKLNDFLPNFLKGGYYCLELLLIQMLSRNPITDKILEKDLKIEKIGYRGRLLNKLKQGKLLCNKYADSKLYAEKIKESKLNPDKKKNILDDFSCRCSIF